MVDRTRAETMALPRGLVLRFPFGRPFGAPGNPDQQRVVLEDALTMLSSARQPGEIRAIPYNGGEKITAASWLSVMEACPPGLN